MSRLNPADVLYLDQDAQFATVPVPCTLVRHRRGLSLIQGVSASQITALLRRFDGKRDLEEIVALSELPGPKARSIIRSLLGDVLLHRGPEPKSAHALKNFQLDKLEQPGPRPKTLVVGNGSLAANVQQILSAMGLSYDYRWLRSDQEQLGAADSYQAAANELSPREARSPITGLTELEPQLASLDLLVCCLEATPYSVLYQIQQACLRTNTILISITIDSDGIRLGPVTIPGLTACLACAHLAHFRFLGMGAAALFSSISQFTTLSAVEDKRWTPVFELFAEVMRDLIANGPNQLIEKTHHEGRVPQIVDTPRVSDCPLCGSSTAARSASDESGWYKAIRGRVFVNRVLVQDHASVTARPGGDPDQNTASIGILGGGAAGYLTALALKRKHPDLEVTLIESPDIPVIGVGEATTPLIPQFLHADLGLDIHEFFAEVKPTFKLGIRFDWGPSAEKSFNYPFGPVHVLDAMTHDGHLGNCSLRSMAMNHDRLSLIARGRSSSAFPGVDIAYHLENRRFVGYLQKKAARFGVRHIAARIVDAVTNEEEIRELISEDGRRFSFDLYIDCSGFQGMLINKKLNSPFKSYGSRLLTDRAVVAAVANDGRLKNHTVAESMSAGWCWNTPQREADHRGYVFASTFLSDADAVAEMRAKNPAMGEARVIRFAPGRHEHFWKGNVVALGNAYGFVEPLESTALHMLIRQIGLLVRTFPIQKHERGIRIALNQKVADFWDYLAWFLGLHFKFNASWNTPFWRACRERIDVSEHGELLELFKERGPLSANPIVRGLFAYPDPLWGPEGIDVILMGQGVIGNMPKPIHDPKQWSRRIAANRELLTQSPNQEQLLALIDHQPELLELFVKPFLAVGPAFVPARSP